MKSANNYKLFIVLLPSIILSTYNLNIMPGQRQKNATQKNNEKKIKHVVEKTLQKKAQKQSTSQENAAAADSNALNKDIISLLLEILNIVGRLELENAILKEKLDIVLNFSQANDDNINAIYDLLDQSSEIIVE